MESDAEGDPLFLRSVARVMQVLNAFNDAHRPLTLSEIATAARIDRSAAQRIVHTLRKLGYIARDDDDRGYMLGLRVLDLTLDFMRLNPLVKRASPILLELRRRVSERVDLSLFDDTRVLYAMRMPSKREAFHATLPGHSVPVYCSSGGVAILARLDDEQARDIVARSDRTPFTAFTMREVEEVMQAVEETRRKGFACLTNQIMNEEVAIGVAITAHDGRPLAAIHIAGSLLEWSKEEFVANFSGLVMEAADAIGS
ncbi:DNA-binding IclR family transcriptional regulator [Pseudochelatococcus lubricantis]|uniref:DNA-binding IclR family transcriptional regulator n=1 Tax=Pseudochelatococcus lubricantis TaxID=1538102 RepID=A0ABX0UTT9_9HYPH|nr:IclR family transcriptional regulator [Pseudochelatococcus lubricantis]NIJ56377.1 DNA-binding IclR family transcriptional regulator [Pseudochelatococcus lubricantis]